MSKLKNIKDGFKNIIKGLGTEKDAREATTFQRGLRISQQVANDLYVYNWIAAKGIDIPIDDATKKWRSFLIPDADQKKAVESAMAIYDVKSKINKAFKWACVFGGAAIVIIIDGEDQKTPLDIGNIRKGSLKNFIVLDRYNIFPNDINRNILSENFGNPEYYTVTRAGELIHHSRVIKIDGETPTILEAEKNNFWGVSKFTKTFSAIADTGTISQSIINLVYEANVDVYKIAGLNEIIAEKEDKLIIDRLKYLHQMKSILNGAVLDSEDDFEKKTTSFMQLPELDDRYMQKVAGAFDIPLTRFLGISPSGLNATGAADLLNYDDNVKSIQENQFRPVLDKIDPIIMASCFGNNDELKYIFNPLRQLTEVEQADVDLKNKDRDIAYVDAGIIRESDVVANLSENGTYVTIDSTRVEEAINDEELDFGEEKKEED